MELKCEVWHKPECSVLQYPRVTGLDSQICDCGAEEIIAFINCQSLTVKKLEQQLTEAQERIEELGTANNAMIKLYQEEKERAEKAEARAKLYDELLYQVANKVPGESRHDTAKRIIFEHENRDCSEPEQALKEE